MFGGVKFRVNLKRKFPNPGVHVDRIGQDERTLQEEVGTQKLDSLLATVEELDLTEHASESQITLRLSFSLTDVSAEYHLPLFGLQFVDGPVIRSSSKSANPKFVLRPNVDVDLIAGCLGLFFFKVSYQAVCPVA
jgi:hypothetical protein